MGGAPMRWQRFGVGLPPTSDEDAVPFDITAFRAREVVALEAKEARRVNLDHLHQDHLCIARLILQRIAHRP